MVHEHTITLTGRAVTESGTSGHLMRDLFQVLVLGAEQSLRFRIEGRSRAGGAPPAWLREASDFRMMELRQRSGERTLRLEAPSLVDTMPGRFAQADLFEDLDPRRSPLELFEDALDEALADKADSEAFDQPLLETCSGFRALLGAGLDSVEIKNGRTVRIDPESIQRVIRLSDVSFARRKVRLAGKLDIIRYSDCRFTLVLDGGEKVHGTAQGPGADTLRNAFGKNVIVTGTAEFRPSGRMLRVDADLVELATDNEVKIFSTVPRPLQAAPVPERTEGKGGLAALLGQWPGDEPIDQLLVQLRQLT